MAFLKPGAIGGLFFRNGRQSAAPSEATSEGKQPWPGRPLEAAALAALAEPVLLVSVDDPDDPTGRRIEFANPAARELLRIAPDTTRLVSAVRRPEVLEAIDESLFGGGARDVSYETQGAQARFWRVRSAPLSVPGDEQTLALVTFHDETDAKRAERSRVDFLANASHELRTPLASLSGFIETLRGHARDDVEARDQFLRIMAAQAERMSRLVDDLMSLSRVELNEHVPPSGVCDMALAAMDVIDALKPITAAKGVRIDLDLPSPGQANVIGDRHQIVQVAQNLLENALKYSNPGGVVHLRVIPDLDAAAAQGFTGPEFAQAAAEGGGRLSLLTPDRSSGARYVLLRIVDEGPGMAREHLPRLSERFYRIEGQKSGERLGTGLGLAIVKHIINRHRGGMGVESAPGRGSALQAYIPALADKRPG